MTGRLKLMLVVLAALAALVLLDRPEPAPEAVQVVEGASRRLPPVVPSPPAAPVAAMPLDAPIPDLFAGGEAAPQASAGPPAGQADAPRAEPEQRPARPFTLLGFREEGTVREAYLLQGGEVVTVRAGDVIKGRYRVLALGRDSVDIKDKQSGAAIRIGFEDHQ